MVHLVSIAGKLVCNANLSPSPSPNPNLNSSLNTNSTLGLLFFCKGANTNFIRRRLEEANPRSESVNSRSINFCELTIVLRKLTLDFI